MKSKIILLILLVVLLITGCGREAIDDDVSVDKPTKTATGTDDPDGPNDPDEPDKPIITKGPTESETITVHNATELVKALAPGKHIYLAPGDYDLQKVKLETEYFSEYKVFSKLRDVTLEGLGDTQVDFLCDDIYADVLSLNNCQAITLINLNIGHTPESDLGGSCEGIALCLNRSSDIRIENCTMFGCGSIGLYASSVSDMVCIDSIVEDCSYTIMTLDSVTNAQFKNCRFEENDANYFEAGDCVNVSFTDCLISGYPAIPCFISYLSLNMDLLYYQDSPGVVPVAEFEGITLKNVTFALGEPPASVKEELAQEAMILDALQGVFPDYECLVDIFTHELSTDKLLDIYIQLDSMPLDDELLAFMMKAMDALSDYPLDMAFTLGLSDSEKHYSFSYGNLRQAIADYAKAPMSVIKNAQYVFLHDMPLNYSILLNSSTLYLDAESGKQIVFNSYPDFVFVYPSFEPVTAALDDIYYSYSYYQYGRVFHVYYADIAEFTLYFTVAADDGTIMEFLGGEAYEVTKPNAEILKGGLEAFKNEGYDIAENERVCVRQLSDDFLEIRTETYYLNYFTFEVRGGKYEFTYYYVQVGD